jgi:hypothetical protein
MLLTESEEKFVEFGWQSSEKISAGCHKTYVQQSGVWGPFVEKKAGAKLKL